jgi:hypothetical protein
MRNLQCEFSRFPQMSDSRVSSRLISRSILSDHDSILLAVEFPSVCQESFRIRVIIVIGSILLIASTTLDLSYAQKWGFPSHDLNWEGNSNDSSHDHNRIERGGRRRWWLKSFSLLPDFEGKSVEFLCQQDSDVGRDHRQCHSVSVVNDPIPGNDVEGRLQWHSFHSNCPLHSFRSFRMRSQSHSCYIDWFMSNKSSLISFECSALCSRFSYLTFLG